MIMKVLNFVLGNGFKLKYGPTKVHTLRFFRCFDQNFPFWHDHPRSSFAVQAVIDTEIGPRPIKGELVTVWEEDILESTNYVESVEQNNGDSQCDSAKSTNEAHTNSSEPSSSLAGGQNIPSEVAITEKDTNSAPFGT